jgi:LytS/YehU family sensor histidine kinase
MIDEILSGMLGGLLGPALAKWLGRFRYWVIFFVAMIAAHVGLFVAGVYAKGFQAAIKITLRETFTPVGILVPMGIGFLVVAVIFVGSFRNKNAPLSSSNKARSDRQAEKSHIVKK